MAMSDYCYVSTSGFGAQATISGYRSVAHLKGRKGHSAWFTYADSLDFVIPGDISGIAGGNHMYVDLHVEWVDASTFTRNHGWFGAGFYWRAPPP
jgi:hypothetical protein